MKGFRKKHLCLLYRLEKIRAIFQQIDLQALRSVFYFDNSIPVLFRNFVRIIILHITKKCHKRDQAFLGLYHIF